MDTRTRKNVSRISISLQQQVLEDLDSMIENSGMGSRSQAISTMINRQLAEHRTSLNDAIMAGTINLVYDHSVPELKTRLTELQHGFIDEVISSLNVNLVDSRTLEVILVQGPARTLKKIADKMISCKGVVTGRLLMSASIMPPLHPLPDKEKTYEYE